MDKIKMLWGYIVFKTVLYTVFTFFLLAPPTGHAKGLQEVVLKLQWLDQFQFAGYYMAKEKGFYENAGLEVKIVPYMDGSQDVVREVINGNVQYGTGRSSLVVDRVIGKRVVMLAAIFQDTPHVLLTRKDTGIDSISDLVGRKVMISPDEIASVYVMGMLAENGLRPHDIIRQKHSYNLDDLVNRKTDAMASYISNEPYILKERGVEFNAFRPQDYGQNFYGDILFTSEKEVRKNPDRVRAFRDASLKGWNYAFDHIEETAKLIKAKYNGQNKSLKSLIFEGEALKRLAYKRNIPLGHISLAKIKTIAMAYHALGVFSDNYRLDGLLFE